jgi:hypothetical protein
VSYRILLLNPYGEEQMQLIEITPEEIILLKIEYAYIFYSNTNYMETIKFNYKTQNVYYFVGEDDVEYWTSFNDFISKNWELFKKETPNTKLYIINEE